MCFLKRIMEEFCLLMRGRSNVLVCHGQIKPFKSWRCFIWKKQRILHLSVWAKRWNTDCRSGWWSSRCRWIWTSRFFFVQLSYCGGLYLGKWALGWWFCTLWTDWYGNSYARYKRMERRLWTFPWWVGKSSRNMFWYS